MKKYPDIKQKKTYAGFYASGDLCATKEPAPCHDAKKKKNRPKTAARKAVSTGHRVPTAIQPFTRQNFCPNNILCPQPGHSDGENKKEGPL
jgi:hypothetical protein